MWSSNKGHIEFGDLRTAFRSQSAKKRSEAEEIARLKQRLTCLKTTSRNSFVWRLSLALAEAYHTCGGIEGLAQFWVKIVAELRHHFERGYVIARCVIFRCYLLNIRFCCEAYFSEQDKHGYLNIYCDHHYFSTTSAWSIIRTDSAL